MVDQCPSLFETLAQVDNNTLPFQQHPKAACDLQCRTPTLAKCGGEAQHLEKSGVGVLRDSRMFRAQQQGAKHLALACSWCHWKGLEA
jgi:hypothetical protein